jgi:selenocysteine-specific translation elongation factor
MPEEQIGQVVDFFARPVVAAIQLTAPLKVGDRIHIKGHSTDVTVTVASMQVHNAAVQEAQAGDPVGVKITDRARKGDVVYKIVD